MWGCFNYKKSTLCFDDVTDTKQLHEVKICDDQHIFLDIWAPRAYRPVQTLEDGLQCSICLDVLVEPVEHRACGNHFCRTCVLTLRQCPLCRMHNVTYDTITNKYILNKLNVRVQCTTCKHVCTRYVFLAQRLCGSLVVYVI